MGNRSHASRYDLPGQKSTNFEIVGQGVVIPYGKIRVKNVKFCFLNEPSTLYLHGDVQFRPRKILENDVSPGY